MKAKTYALIIMSSLLLIGGNINSAQAGDGSPVGPGAKQLAPAPKVVIAASRVLKTTKIVSDNALIAVGAGFQPIDPASTVNCPGAFGTTCTLGAEQNVQVRGAAAGRWAICTQVDGFFLAEPLCPFLGSVPADGSFVAGSFAQSARGLTPGLHTVQTFLYTDGGADLSIYNIAYRIYKQ